MKSTKSSKMSFGFAIVNAGVRKNEYEPELVALSTVGGFRITPQVSTALGLQHGDNIMFLHQDARAAAIAKNEAYVSFCNEHSLDVDSAESVDAFVAAFDMWAIAKGIVLKTDKGAVQMVNERLTKKDKVTYVEQNFDSVLAEALAEEGEVKDALSREGITHEEQVEILVSLVTPRELPKYSGSKLANSSALMGTGTVLTFTDSNVWDELKADMSADMKETHARAFAIDPTDVQTTMMSNGFEEVEVKFLVLGSYTDKKVERISAKKDAE